MKVMLIFKTPDVLEQATNAVTMTSDDAAAIERLFKKYVLFGEVIKVQLDTDTGSATVVPIVPLR